MYQIFVVEDESLIRQSIRHMVENLEGPYSFCGEASDGEMALSMMQDLMPDIVLTDIRMPFLDGFELISHLKKMMPWVRIIIISGFGDFSYAQKAITLGVDQYLLKPIRPADLNQAVAAVAKDIERERETKTNTAGFDADEVRNALYQKYMKDLLHGGMNTSTALDQARMLGLEIVYPCYQVIIFSFDSEGFDHRALRMEAKRLMEELSLAFHWFNGSDRFTVLLTGQDQESVTEQAYRIITILRHELQHVSPVITTVVGNVVQRISNISDAYITAKDLVKKVSGVAAGRVVDANDTAQITADIIGYSGLLDEHFRKRLAAVEEEQVPQLVDEYLASEEGRQFDSMLIRYNTLVNVMKLTAQMLEKNGSESDQRDYTAEISGQYDILSLVGRKEAFRDAMVELLQKAVAKKKNARMESKYRHVINRAVEYIGENYCDPNITLQSAARHVSISPAHFSTIFSQTMGTTFINYLTDLRIGRAKELLTETDMKLAAIAMEVGYNEPNYFSHVFRKSVGMTPKEYRGMYTNQ